MAQDASLSAIKYLQKEYQGLDLSADDVSELTVTDNYPSPSGVRHVYVNQTHNGILVENAQAILHFRGDNLVHRTSRLIPALHTKVIPSTPALSAQTAVTFAANLINNSFGTPTPAGTEGATSLFDWDEVSRRAIRARLLYVPTETGEFTLTWRVAIDHTQSADYWMIFLDATTGEEVKRNNLTLYCSFGPAMAGAHRHNASCTHNPTKDLPVHEQMLEAVVADGASYNVFPFGEESPIHGDREIIVNPADSIASPFGWHDTNGRTGPEFTITRGNNVWTYPDRDADNSPDEETNDGGQELIFDDFFAFNQNADTLLPAALTQNFYMSNMVHDWVYHAGFDEAAGNFQRNNYTDEGEDRDVLFAEAQDGSGTNNANFATPPDGQSPRMQMFLWVEAQNPPVFNVDFPATLEGTREAGQAGFGPVIGSIPVSGRLAIGTDDSADPTLGCEAITSDVAGKVALINRGECFFEQKVFNAQEAGAIAVVVCNPENEIFGMAESPDPDEFDVTIPSVLIRENDCAPLRVAITRGDSVAVTFQSLAPPPIVGDFDNGVVAHEIGHGISNRLVGGPSNASCLFNDEQMGEGWSDFFALASSPTTIVDNPDGSEPRGIGNFSTRQPIDGRGIRRLRYSNDFNVNNYTYDNVIWNDLGSGAPHQLGEIWATTLWDMYWALVDEYGFDEDLIHGTGGNNLAVELVVEGLKYTACQPGLVDGRDGILAADEIENDGANQCLIWEVFARRGIGFSARQGNSNNRRDNKQAFDIDPACSKAVVLEKTTDTPNINPGEGVTYTLRAINYKEVDATDVTITDIIPDGMTLDENSIRGANDYTIDGNTVTFQVGDIKADDGETIVYSVSTDPDLASTRYYFDGAEDGDDDWDLVSLEGNFIWEIADTTPFAGDLVWYIVNAPSSQDQALSTFEPLPVSGDNPMLRFFTKYETEAGWDAGVVEVSSDNTNWVSVDDLFLRGNYRGNVAREGLPPLQGRQSFWGDSDGYQEILLDLRAYAGQDVYVRWRFLSDDNTNERGWWVDNIELMDGFNYQSTATLSSAEGDIATADVPEFGVLVESADVTNTVDPELGQTEVNVFPNPAGQFVNVSLRAERTGTATVQLLSVDGRMLHREVMVLVDGRAQTKINTANLPAGVYIVQVTGQRQVSTTKLTVK
jgi:extracellular elastinolytic metalloproteinase